LTQAALNVSERHSISVIIPAYNRAGLIGETLQSLLNQTLPAKEIIVVDDGSTDGTGEAVEHEFSVFSKQLSGNSKFKIQNPTLKILRQANSGPGVARNRGLREATGKYILFFDSDDIAMPDRLGRQVDVLENSGADIAVSPWIKFHDYGMGIEFDNFIFQSALPDASSSLLEWWLQRWSIVLQAMLFRRSFIDKIGTFREDMPSHQDSEFMTRVWLHEPQVAFNKACGTLYRIHKMGNITSRDAKPALQRVVDQAIFLLGAYQASRLAQMRIKWSARQAIRLALFKCLRDFDVLKSSQHPLAREIKSKLSTYSWFFFQILDFADRIETRWRYELTGSRCVSSMKVCKLSEEEKTLFTHVLQYVKGGRRG
jgi:glycosyltransferase involved in cell wall biosynthesis